MSKALANLLGEPEHFLTPFIEKLENLSGLANEDIRILNEMSHRVMSKNISLGLDPRDTNGRELYHAAQIKFATDCTNFENLTGAVSPESLDKKLKRLTKLAGHSGANPEVWALKQSVAKELLRAHPPKALMRQLHYRSVDSMLKHEDIVGLFGAIPFATSARWQKSFWKGHFKLSPLDFEQRKLQVVGLPAKRWQGLSPSSTPITSVAELGTVVIWPTVSAEKTNTLALLVLVLQAVEQVHLLSTVAKAQQGRGSYGEIVSKIWQGQLPLLATLAGHSISWQSFLHHLGRQPDSVHPAEFEPYIYPQDLHWQSVNDQISLFHPSLAWWRGSSYFLHGTDGGVSLNAADVSLNHVRGAGFGQRSQIAGRMAFWDELITRYLGHPIIFNRVVGQLEQSLSPAVIRVVSDEINISDLNAQAQAV